MKPVKLEERFGLHRVLEPKGVFPQQAERLDNSLPIHDSELLIDVEMINIDAASFTQLKKEANNNPDRLAEKILKIVQNRGKLHNPVTDSGGMLIGRVKEMGKRYTNRDNLKTGSRIATLVSLTLTPLHITRIKRVHLNSHQIEVDGYAILFDSGVACSIDNVVDQRIALSALDVAGVVPTIERLVHPGKDVLIIGSGKSGSLACAAAKRVVKNRSKISCVDIKHENLIRLKKAGYCDNFEVVDATRPMEILYAAKRLSKDRLFDIVINTAPIPMTEMGTILATKDGGIAYFFNMATSFQRATLGAEGIGKDITLIMGNGYVQHNGRRTLDFLEQEPQIVEILKTFLV